MLFAAKIFFSKPVQCLSLNFKNYLSFVEDLVLMLSNKNRHSYSLRWSLIFIFWFALTFPSSSFAIYIQLDGIADVKTNFSDGCASIKDIGNQSERLGIDAVIFGDFARNSIEFGAKPFERIFKNSIEISLSIPGVM